MVLPDGDCINRRISPGKNLKEQIDNWHTTNANNTTVTSNFVEVNNPLETTQFSWIQEGDKEGDSPSVTECEIEEIRMLESFIATTQKKVDETKKRMARTGPTMRSAAQKEDLVPKQATPGTKINNGTPMAQQQNSRMAP